MSPRGTFLFALAIVLTTSGAVRAQNVELPETNAHVALVERIFASANSPETITLDAAYDMDAYVDRALEGLSSPAPTMAQMRAGFMSTGALSFARILASKGEFQISDMGRYRRAGLEVLRMRMVFERGGFEMIDFAVHEVADGDMRIFDHYAMSVGEWASTMVNREFHQAMLPALQLTPRVRFLREVARLRLEGRAREALDLVLRLPLAERDDRTLLLFWVTCAMEGGTDEEYVAALSESLRVLGDDPATVVQGIDLAYLTHRWDVGFRALAKLEQEFGANAYFDVLRSTMSSAAGSLEDARRYVESAVAREPTLVVAHQVALDTYVALGRHADAIRALRALEALGMRFDGFDSVEGYERFVGSEAYAQWWRTRAR